MAAARYAPLGEASLFSSPTVPSAPAIVTGSLQAGEAKAAAIPGAPVRQPQDTAQDVRAILAQASSDRPSQGTPAQQQRGAAKRTREESEDPGEIYTGGTGLLDEVDTAAKEHPLAAKFPGDYLVVCEAGCRPSSDLIVYKVSKIAAANAAKAQRKLEVTSGAEGAAAESNEIVCIAGCYDDEPVKRQADIGKPASAIAQNEAPEPLKVAAAQPRADDGKEQEHRAPASANAAAAETVSTPAVVAQAVKAEAPIAAITTASITTAVSPAAQVVSVSAVPAVAADVSMPVAPKAEPIASGTRVSTMPVNEIAALHAISAETAARFQSKRATAAAKAEQPSWEAKVTSLVVLKKPAQSNRSVVALRTMKPFETTLSVEHGWDFTLLNTP
jgi:hypothetical protein